MGDKSFAMKKPGEGLAEKKVGVFGQGNASTGNPFAPTNSKIAEFIKTSTQGNDNKGTTEGSKKKAEDSKETEELNCRYAMPEEKKKIFNFTKMDGVNFSRIIQKK